MLIEKSLIAGYWKLNGLGYPKYQYDIQYDNIDAIESEINFSLVSKIDRKPLFTSRGYAEVDGANNWDELMTILNMVGALSTNDVTIQDSTSNILIGTLSKEAISSTLSVQADVSNNYTNRVITVSDSTGFLNGAYASIFSVVDNRFYLARIISVTNNDIEMDTPLDFPFPVGSYVTGGNINLGVDGSVTPQIFGLRNTAEFINSAFHVTRIMPSFLCDNPLDLSKFGDIIGGLVNGLIIRKKYANGGYRNLFHFRSNAAIKNLLYDFEIESAQGSQQDGANGRLSLTRLGSVVEILPGDDIQAVVQDAQHTTGMIMAISIEGHEVT